MLHQLKTIVHAAICFAAQMQLLVVEVPIVWFFMWRLKANALPTQHAWLTGALTTDSLCNSMAESTQDQSSLDQSAPRTVWARNIVYRSATRSVRTAAVDDHEVADKTGEFLRRMVAKSSVEVAHGPKRRMPHAVNYIHGAVHYNGLTLIFDDFLDLARHLHDSKFRSELQRVAKMERREVTFLFRQRDYDVLEFAYCVGVVRNFLPWFSNANGPSKKPVLWGNVAPYPAINLINGAWVRDIQRLSVGKLDQLARPSVNAAAYFQASYGQTPVNYRWLDRFQAWWISMDVRARGFRGQLFFTNRRRIEPHRLDEYRAAGGYMKWSACHKVPFPLPQASPTHSSQTSSASASAQGTSSNSKLSVIIPTLNEALTIAECINSVRAEWPGAEIIISDGGSQDHTVQIAQALGARITPREENDTPGRGAQLLRGIAASTRREGQIILLLHADSRIAAHTGAALQIAFSDQALNVAKLSVHFDSTARRYRLLEQICKIECALSSFGDQGMAVRRDFLDAHLLLLPMPLFEDVEFFARARKLTPVARLPVALWTSTRRFQRLGFVQTNLINAALVTLYFCGVPPSKLYQIYYAQKRQKKLVAKDCMRV